MGGCTVFVVETPRVISNGEPFHSESGLPLALNLSQREAPQRVGVQVQQMSSLPFPPLSAASLCARDLSGSSIPASLAQLSLPHCLSRMCHLCVLSLFFRLSFSPHAVSHPEMSPSLVCLENSYAYSKARLLCCVFVVFPDSAKQIMGPLMSQRTLHLYVVPPLGHLSLSRPAHWRPGAQ